MFINGPDHGEHFATDSCFYEFVPKIVSNNIIESFRGIDENRVQCFSGW